jgi:hypothetical protein
VTVYLLGAGPLLWSEVSHPFHRCWLREYGQELGVRFHKARYRQYPIEDSSDASHLWNYENKSMTWAKNWRGARAAIYFSKNDGPAFVARVHARPRSMGLKMDSLLYAILGSDRQILKGVEACSVMPAV